MRRFYDYLPVAAQNLACTIAGYQRNRQRFTQHYHRTVQRWERTKEGPEEALYALQYRRLKDLFEVARKHVPYYAELPPVVACSDPREGIERTLRNIPPLEKSTYRDAPLAFLNRSVPRRRLIMGTTSGTTGTALRLHYTPEALAEEYATVWRMRQDCGVSTDAPHMTFGGRIIVPYGQNEAPFWRIDHYSQNTLFSLYHMTKQNLGAYVDAIHDRPARFVQGYPSSLHVVARALLDAGRPLPKGRLTAVFTSSESLLAFQRDAIEQAFQAPVYDRYGASELAVSMTSGPDGLLHVDMEFCIVEVEPLEETEDYVMGPLLVTGLGNLATPFIRYRIGDIGTIPRKAIATARPGPVFLDVDGRIEDYVVTPDGRKIGRLDHIFKGQYQVAEAQILQDTPDAIVVQVVTRPGYDEAAERRLLREIRSRVGQELKVSIGRVEAIPREPNGKLRLVKSRVGRPLP